MLVVATLFIPPKVKPPEDQPKGSVTIMATPRDTKVYLLPPRGQNEPEAFLGYVGKPILPESLLDSTGSAPKSLQLTLKRKGFMDRILKFDDTNHVYGFLSKPVYPPEGVFELHAKSALATLEVWMKERRVSLAALAVLAVMTLAATQAKSKAACRADLLEALKARAGTDPYIGTSLKEFIVVELLGRGSFGMVYRAIPEQHLGQSDAEKYAVAIKISTNLDPKAVQRFYQELDVARQAEHPNIVRIFDKGQTGDESPFLVMELLSGRAMTALVSQEPEDEGEPKYLAFAPHEVARILEPVVAGLQHAHDNGVVHRDLNPNNVMILQGGGTKILDFGLSKLVANKGLTMTQDAGAGTLKYVPYEQIVGFGKVDARADQFSLGCMMYHMLAGSHPFGELPFEVLTNVSQRRPARPLAKSAPGLDQQSAAVVEQMLSHDPEQRYPTVQEAFNAFVASLA